MCFLTTPSSARASHGTTTTMAPGEMLGASARRAVARRARRAVARPRAAPLRSGEAAHRRPSRRRPSRRSGRRPQRNGVLRLAVRSTTLGPGRSLARREASRIPSTTRAKPQSSKPTERSRLRYDFDTVTPSPVAVVRRQARFVAATRLASQATRLAASGSLTPMTQAEATCDVSSQRSLRTPAITHLRKRSMRGRRRALLPQRRVRLVRLASAAAHQRRPSRRWRWPSGSNSASTSGTTSANMPRDSPARTSSARTHPRECGGGRLVSGPRA